MLFRNLYLTLIFTTSLFASLFSLANEIPAEASRECRNFITSLPSEYKWGFIKVDEKWDQANSKKINVFYYYYDGAPKNPENIPYVFFNGGPSSDSHGTLRMFQNNAEARATTAVTLDQRGTGCSTQYPKPTSLDMTDVTRYWGTESIVRDAEALRTHLFKNRKWKIFGQSYGALISLRYLENFPESIYSANIHGFTVMKSTKDFLTKRILSQQRVLKDIANKHPNLLKNLKEVRELVPNNFCLENKAAKICGAPIIDAFSIYMGFIDAWQPMDQILQQLNTTLRHGDTSFLKQWGTQTALGVFAGGEKGVFPNLISAMEIAPGYTDIEGCKLVEEHLESSNIDWSHWLVNECRILSAIEFKKRATEEYTVQPSFISLEQIRSNLMKYSDLKVYLYSGEKDTFIPSSTFDWTVQHLGPLIEYTNFQDSGHGGFSSEKLVWQNLLKNNSSVQQTLH